MPLHVLRRHLILAAAAALLITTPARAQTPMDQTPAAYAASIKIPDPRTPIASKPGALTLQQVLDAARLHNPTLIAAQRNLEAVRAQEIQAALRQNPYLQLNGSEITYDANAQNPYTYSAQISRLFERGNKREWRIDNAKATTALTASQLEDQIRQTNLTLKTAFTAMLEAKADLQITTAELAEFQHEVDIAQYRYKAGDLARIDFERLDLQLAAFESAESTDIVNLRQASDQLQTLIGVPPPPPTSTSPAPSSHPHSPKTSPPSSRPRSTSAPTSPPPGSPSTPPSPTASSPSPTAPPTPPSKSSTTAPATKTPSASTSTSPCASSTATRATKRPPPSRKTPPASPSPPPTTRSSPTSTRPSSTTPNPSASPTATPPTTSTKPRTSSPSPSTPSSTAASPSSTTSTPSATPAPSTPPPSPPTSKPGSPSTNSPPPPPPNSPPSLFVLSFPQGICVCTCCCLFFAVIPTLSVVEGEGPPYWHLQLPVPPLTCTDSAVACSSFAAFAQPSRPLRETPWPLPALHPHQPAITAISPHSPPTTPTLSYDVQGAILAATPHLPRPGPRQPPRRAHRLHRRPRPPHGHPLPHRRHHRPRRRRRSLQLHLHHLLHLTLHPHIRPIPRHRRLDRLSPRRPPRAPALRNPASTFYAASSRQRPLRRGLELLRLGRSRQLPRHARPRQHHPPPAELALLCQRAENNFVHSPCGIMDQFVITSARAGHALLLNTRDLTFEHIPMNTGALAQTQIVVCNSGVKHAIADGDGGYAQRRRESELGQAVLLDHFPTLRGLGDATLAQLESIRSLISPEAFRRCRHIITDNARVRLAREAMFAGDPIALGRLMLEGHASERDDFQCSCPEIDLLVDIATNLPGCYGARLTGGGFGGCTVNLVDRTHAESFAHSLKQSYQQHLNRTAETYLCNPTDGAIALTR